MTSRFVHSVMTGVFGTIIGFASMAAYGAGGRPILHKDLQTIGHGATVADVTFVQIASPTGGFNPTAIELEISTESYCFGVAADFGVRGKFRVVETLPSGAFASGGCTYAIQYFWTPSADLSTAVGSTRSVTLEVGPVLDYSTRPATEKWYKVTADLTHKLGKFKGGEGHYAEYANVTITAP